MRKKRKIINWMLISRKCIWIPAEKRAALIQILEQDPRPSYQKDPVRIYGMSYAGMEIHFRVDKETLYVTGVERS